MPTLLAVTKLK